MVTAPIRARGQCHAQLSPKQTLLSFCMLQSMYVRSRRQHVVNVIGGTEIQQLLGSHWNFEHGISGRFVQKLQRCVWDAQVCRHLRRAAGFPPACCAPAMTGQGTWTEVLWSLAIAPGSQGNKQPVATEQGWGCISTAGSWCKTPGP